MSIDDCTAANDCIVVIDDGGLARGDGPLRVIKGHVERPAVGRLNQRWGGGVPVANLDGGAEWLSDCRHRDQVQSR